MSAGEGDGFCGDLDVALMFTREPIDWLDDDIDCASIQQDESLTHDLAGDTNKWSTVRNMVIARLFAPPAVSILSTYISHEEVDCKEANVEKRHEHIAPARRKSTAQKFLPSLSSGDPIHDRRRSVERNTSAFISTQTVLSPLSPQRKFVMLKSTSLEQSMSEVTFKCSLH
jgi:hypothetical protein